MKKFTLVLAFAIMFSITHLYSQNRSIQFIDKPWSEILAQAKAENKLVFLDAFASWCGPCKWMAANIFTNDSVADYFNSTFICVSLDMEKGEGITLRNKYQVRYFPTLLFINQDGEIVHQRVGAARNPSDYISMGAIALNPQENLQSYMKRYEAGEMSDAFIQAFLQHLAEAYIPVKTVLQKYFAGKSEADLFSRPCWSIIVKHVDDMNAPQFEFLVKHEEEFSKLYGKDSVFNKISEIYLTALVNQTRTALPTDTMYKIMKKKILESGFEGATKVIFASDLNMYQMHRDNQKFLDLAYDGLEKFYHDDYQVLNTLAAEVGQMCQDKSDPNSLKYLEKAKSWCRRSIEIKSEPANNDTYATLLLQTGQINEAISYEKTAISLGKKFSVPTDNYENRLKNMEAQQK